MPSSSYPLNLYKPLTLTVDEKGNLSGNATFIGDYTGFVDGSAYPELKVGNLYKDILGATDPYNLVITNIDCKPMGVDNVDDNTRTRLGEITVRCSNEVKYIDENEKYNFSVSIQSAIQTEVYRGNAFWANLGMALPENEKEFQIPYAIVTLSGTYKLMGVTNSGVVVTASAIISQLNTINAAVFPLGSYSDNLGDVPIGCAKFVGFSYEESSENTSSNPSCIATFTFHVRGFNWNWKIRPAEIMKDASTGQELYWQNKYSWMPTYVGNVVSGATALPGTPIWAGTNSVLGGDSRLAHNVFDYETSPRPDGTFGLEFPEVAWCFI